MNENGRDKSHNLQDHLVTEERRVKPRMLDKVLPPHIAWPFFVVGLLVLGVGWSMWVVFASSSDGGAQVVENYYEKAVNWDDRHQLIQQSIAAGWRVDIKYVPDASPEKRGIIEIRINDKDGRPVENLRGSVKIYRPQTTKAMSEMAFNNVVGRPGVYTQLFQPAPGLWDFEIAAERDSFHFLKVIRKEF